MKCRDKQQSNMSIFAQKQQFIDILLNEFEHCGFKIVLNFESSFRKRIGKLKVDSGRHVELYINLDYVRKSVDIDGCSLMFKVWYCALFISEYIKQIERAKSFVPQSYFEGVAFLNAIEVFKSETIVSVYSPLSCMDRNVGRTHCVRPLEISSAINALKRIRLSDSNLLNEQDKKTIKAYCDSLLLYAELPEVSYTQKSVPVYTIVDSFKKLATLIEKEPGIVQEFPVLALAPFDRIEQLTMSELFLTCIQSDNTFLIGIAIRLIAFLHLPCDIELNASVQNKLVAAMNWYIKNSIFYCSELSKSERGLKRDNLFAIKIAVKEINTYLMTHETDVISGNIHTIV